MNFLRLSRVTCFGLERLMVLGFFFFVCCGAPLQSRAEPPVRLSLVGDFKLNAVLPRADRSELSAVLEVPPPTLVTVKGEKIVSLPVFNPKTAGWVKGFPLSAVRAQECTTPYLLEAESLELRTGPQPDAPQMIRGTDYDLDPAWATVGRLTNGSLKETQPVYVSYRHGLLRVDSIVLTHGRIELRSGQPKPAAPRPPALADDEKRLANIWIPGRIAQLSEDNLFPVLESAFPEGPRETPTGAEKFAPKAIEKLRQARPLRILAWGDSVTVGTYLADWEHQRWQDQFVARLRERFPGARIELITEAWGGRNTGSYLAEPPGSEHNYAEKVLGPKPDLIISEFVNDAGLNEDQVEKQYGKLLNDFKSIGAEWIILTPHYVRTDWMGLKKEKDIDEDPRHYVKGLRQFAARHQVTLADASLRYGRLWREGIPYSTLMLNSINHPDERGMSLFADSLMILFPTNNAK